MITWYRQCDGTYQKLMERTEPHRGHVRIQIYRDNIWQPPAGNYTLKAATQIVEDAIAKGLTTCQGYRIVPRPADPEAAEYFKTLKQKTASVSVQSAEEETDGKGFQEKRKKGKESEQEKGPEETGSSGRHNRSDQHRRSA